MKNTLEKISKIVDNNTVMKILSILVAIIIWFVVVTSITPEIPRVIIDVPVDFDIENTLAGGQGLRIVGDDNITIDVEVEGPRYIVGELTAEDIIVKADISAVADSGLFSVTLNASRRDDQKDYTILPLSPKSISIYFDYFETIELELESKVVGLGVTEEYIAGETTSNVSVVSISGPRDEVNSISRVTATVDVSGEAARTKSFSEEVDIILYNVSGEVVDTGNLKLSDTTADVTIPVLKKAQVPITFEYINIPFGFDNTILNIKLSQTVVEVAAEESIVGNLEELNIGYIDISELEPGAVKSFSIVLSEGFINLSDFDKVTATLANNDLLSKSFTVEDIKLKNVPEDITATIGTSYISSVRIIGTSDDIASISANDIIAEIDMSTVALEEGETKLAVNIVIPSNNSLYAVGNYTVVVHISPK